MEIVVVHILVIHVHQKPSRLHLKAHGGVVRGVDAGLLHRTRRAVGVRLEAVHDNDLEPRQAPQLHVQRPPSWHAH
eukprot:10442713-Karenia_brevis.AAC.1